MHHPTAQHFLQAFRRCLATAILCTFLSIALPSTSVAASAERKKATSDVSQEVKKKGSVNIKHQPSPSEEGTAERERRLYRECRGRPNAGACLGFTRR